MTDAWTDARTAPSSTHPGRQHNYTVRPYNRPRSWEAITQGVTFETGDPTTGQRMVLHSLRCWSINEPDQGQHCWSINEPDQDSTPPNRPKTNLPKSRSQMVNKMRGGRAITGARFLTLSFCVLTVSAWTMELEIAHIARKVRPSGSGARWGTSEKGDMPIARSQSVLKRTQIFAHRRHKSSPAQPLNLCEVAQ